MRPDERGTLASPRQRQIERITTARAVRGIRIIPHGRGFRLVGAGVDFVVSDLSIVTIPRDLLAIEAVR